MTVTAATLGAGEVEAVGAADGTTLTGESEGKGGGDCGKMAHPASVTAATAAGARK
ncbi:hypothetical protein [Demequina oxidasica]|uniref:hypothetical protein n=1 Tax=Demequina oxidasica TaxID=676199 RepID=UPI001364D6A8|nr:hypothetical protein [Demequina oxidasica]